jgi:hypothetical protein
MIHWYLESDVMCVSPELFPAEAILFVLTSSATGHSSTDPYGQERLTQGREKERKESFLVELQRNV